MDLAARPHITAGVALAAAGIVAVTPVTQHLPNLHLGQRLSQVSVSDIRLTDAAEGLVDLLSGVENELASLANGVNAAAVPAAALADVLSPITQNLIVQTWATTGTVAGADLQTLFNTWLKLPAPVLQQIAANGLSYVSDYVGSLQAATNAAVNYYPTLVSGTQIGINNIMAGNIATGIEGLYTTLDFGVLENIALQLANIPKIPGYALQNLASGYSYVAGNLVPTLGLQFLANLPGQAATGLGTSLQAVYNAYTAGNLLGAVTNLFNTPGVVAMDTLLGLYTKAIGGTYYYNNGLLSVPVTYIFNGMTRTAGNGTLNSLLTTELPALAQAIVAPNAQNIASGGSLVTAFQGLANQLVNGWPSLTPVINSVSSGLTSLLRSIPSVMANLPSILSNAGTLLANNIGLLITNLLKLL
ncbi:hypothetical protein [Mycobacterium malmoense]|uniref:hypothetical protein n=1 Tax=Mycobacterium malmoense TaxID=1780 RepID=UPI00114D4C2D|nr:hypothetical protein [Mycobacterium malmoense]